jgi:hypothetical protein
MDFCEGMVNAQLLWKQLNALYITADLLRILFSLRVHSSQYSHPLTLGSLSLYLAGAIKERDTNVS